MRGWLAGLVIGSLAAGAALAAAPTPAVAAASPWVPPSWTSTAAGDSAAGRKGLSGGSVGITVGAGQWTYGAPAVPVFNHFGAPAYRASGAIGSIQWDLLQCLAGDYGSNYCYPNYNPADGALVTLTGTYAPLTCSDGFIFNTSLTTVQGGVINDWCATNGHGPAVSVTIRSTGNSTAYVQSSTLSLVVTESLTTELTCRSIVTGQDETVSETAVGTAPAPVCPAGTIPVRVKVTSSVSGVIQDTSMSTNWADWLDYLNGGGGAAVPGVGGFPCLVGMFCDIDPWWESPSPPPSNADCWLVMGEQRWVLSASDCQAASDEGNLNQDQGSGETANGTDLGPFMKIVEAGIKGIIGVIQGVKSAVDKVKSAIDAVRSAVDRVISGINGAKDAIVSAITSGLQGLLQGLEGLLKDLFTCETGKCPGGGAALGGAGAAMLSKFDVSAWEASTATLAQSFAPGSCSCEGFRWQWTWGAGTGRAVVIDQPIGYSCQGPMLQMADFSRLVSRLVVIFGVLAASWRFVAAAFSFVSPVASALARESRGKEE